MRHSFRKQSIDYFCFSNYNIGSTSPIICCGSFQVRPNSKSWHIIKTAPRVAQLIRSNASETLNDYVFIDTTRALQIRSNCWRCTRTRLGTSTKLTHFADNTVYLWIFNEFVWSNHVIYDFRCSACHAVMFVFESVDFEQIIAFADEISYLNRGHSWNTPQCEPSLNDKLSDFRKAFKASQLWRRTHQIRNPNEFHTNWNR